MRRHWFAVVQAACAAVAMRRLSRGRDRRPPLVGEPVPPSVRVGIPARNEEGRLGGCLSALGLAGVAGAGVGDRWASDGTAGVARSLGARVVQGRPLPDGWVGKPWALQQGLEAASGDVVVTLDADTRPAAGLFGALAAVLERDADFVSVGPRFVCESV